MTDYTRIYIDTEFSNLIDMCLLSIGLVGESGEEYYAEVAGVNRNACSDFTLSTVVPLLGQQPSVILTPDEMRDTLLAWLAQMRREHATLVVSYDYYGDYVLLVEALGGTPTWLRGDNIRDRVSALATAEFWRSTQLLQHHALHDALALRHAHQAWQLSK